MHALIMNLAMMMVIYISEFVQDVLAAWMSRAGVDSLVYYPRSFCRSRKYVQHIRFYDKL